MALRRFLVTVCVLAVASVTFAAGRAWEEVDRLPVAASVEQRAENNDELYITVSDGYVYVVVRQRTTVKIFTILGQLIVQDTLQPGIYRYRMTSRGIYLLKAGSVTRRVTL